MSTSSNQRDLMVVDALPPTPTRPRHFSNEERNLIKETVVSADLTDAEFALFIQIAERRGLDPLENQITAVKRYDSRLHRNRMSVQTTIDGLRLIAQETHELAGIARPIWGPLLEGNGFTYPEWAEATVYRGRPGEPAAAFTAVVWWDEFCATDKDGTPTSFWRRMPRHMLYKVALAHAIRSAFQKQTSGLYTDDEMAQADNADAAAAARTTVTPTTATATRQPAALGSGQADEPLATEQQRASIRKLCAALNKREPTGPITYQRARELITVLSGEYRAYRHGGKGPSATSSASAQTPQKLTWSIVRLLARRLGYQTQAEYEAFVEDVTHKPGLRGLTDEDMRTVYRTLQRLDAGQQSTARHTQASENDIGDDDIGDDDDDAAPEAAYDAADAADDLAEEGIEA